MKVSSTVSPEDWFVTVHVAVLVADIDEVSFVPVVVTENWMVSPFDTETVMPRLCPDATVETVAEVALLPFFFI